MEEGSKSELVISRFKENFPPKKINQPRQIKEFYESSAVDEKYFYRHNSCYFFSELVKNVTKVNTAYQWRRIYMRENKSGVCPTLTANMGTGGHNVPIIKVAEQCYRKLTPRECFNLQGYPNNFKLPSDIANTQLYKQAGNSVTVPLIRIIADVISKCFE